MTDPPEIFKFRFSVHIVKGDWSPTPMTAHDLHQKF